MLICDILLQSKRKGTYEIMTKSQVTDQKDQKKQDNNSVSKEDTKIEKKKKKKNNEVKKENTSTSSKTEKKKTSVTAKVKLDQSNKTKTAKTVKKAKPQTMADLFNDVESEIVVPKKGQSITGVVMEKTKKGLRVNLRAKTEGIVSDKEFDFAQEFVDRIKVGDTIEAIVVSSESDDGRILLSLKNAAAKAKWEFFQKALENEEILEAKGIETNKGGLIVLVNGVRGFVPSSQFGRLYVGHLDQIKGKTLKVKPIEVDSEKNRLIFSERHVSEAEQLAQKDKALQVVKEGGIYEGVVSGIMPFGLFVTVEIPVEIQGKKAAVKDEKKKSEAESDNQIGYIEGLIHISEISWEKVNNPKDYHNVGDRIKVKVLGIDDKTGKLNLSVKQLHEDPWVKIGEKYPVGTTFTGTVSRLEPFGIFVNVEPGVDGLMHSSKLSTNRQFVVGDKIAVNVESIDVDRRRISLSLVKTEVPMGYK